MVAGACAAYLAAAGIVFLPWLLKNWLLSGSPVYPLLIPAGDMDALRQWFYTRPDLAVRDPLSGVLLLARATLFGIQGGNNYDEQPRLFFFGLPALALLGLSGLAATRGLDWPALRTSRIMNAGVGLVLALTAVEYGLYFVSHNPLGVVTGMQSPQDYLAAHLGWHPLAFQRVNALPPGSRVEFLWEARSLLCTPQVVCVPDVVIDRWWHLRRTVGGVPAILDRWRGEGVSHILVYEAGLSYVRAQSGGEFDATDWAALDAVRAQLVPLETIGDAYTLYALP
jgi:hypothetical protein